MTLYAFQSGGDTVDKCMADPFDLEVGKKVFTPWFCYLVTHPQGNVLFDTGADPALIREDPRERFGDWADALDIKMVEGDDVVSKLASVGMKPEDVNHVVMSHLHFDHASALPLFRHAKILVQRAELAWARQPAIYQAGTYHADDFAGDFNWQFLDGPHDVFGDGVVEIFPTPGHTPGHQSMLFRGDESTVFVLGDATYSLPKMRERKLPAFLWSPDAMIASWNWIEWLEAKEGAELLYTHDEDYETRVRLAPHASYS